MIGLKKQVRRVEALPMVERVEIHNGAAFIATSELPIRGGKHSRLLFRFNLNSRRYEPAMAVISEYGWLRVSPGTYTVFQVHYGNTSSCAMYKQGFEKPFFSTYSCMDQPWGAAFMRTRGDLEASLLLAMPYVTDSHDQGPHLATRFKRVFNFSVETLVLKTCRGSDSTCSSIYFRPLDPKFVHWKEVA